MEEREEKKNWAADDKGMRTKENQQLDKTQRIEKLENANYKTAAKKWL